MEKEKLKERDEDQNTAAVQQAGDNRELRECEQRQRGDSIHGVATKRGAKGRTVKQ